MSQFEVKKMKQGMSYSCKEKTIILNVFKYFRNEHPDKCITDLVRRTARATGCSEKSIFQFRKEEASAEGFREPSRTKIRKSININSRDVKYNDNVRQAIRKIIYEAKFQGTYPSLNAILKRVKMDVNLPSFSLMTLRRLMFDMGFCYEKEGNKWVLVEKSALNKTEGQAKSKKPESNTKIQQNAQYASTNNSKILIAPELQTHNTEISNNYQQSISHHQQQHYQSISQPYDQRLVPMHLSMHDIHGMSSMQAAAPSNLQVRLDHRNSIMHPLPNSNISNITGQDMSSWIFPQDILKPEGSGPYQRC